MESILVIMSIFAGVLIGASATILIGKIRKDGRRNEEAPKRVLVDLLATQFPELNRLLSTPPDEVSVHLEGGLASDPHQEARTATVRVRTGKKEDSVTFDVTNRPDLWEILLTAASPSHKRKASPVA